MEANGCVSLEEIEQYNYMANQTFKTEEEFYKFYNGYAFHKGFSVRKDRIWYKPSTKEVTWRRFVFSFEGYRMEKHLKGRIRKDSHVP
ncbi:hypothetical protein GQ55_6G279200 [Panicum hallii var. hallii]|uniref:FAR1 domain-containing protein n=1 Tax=Panicum hallii var. hallii TaxID=1504633 RepID=A0A2T7DAD6_9POAL|nr:hypothetical protein GQ55_6G279200 [Panicum hallii var. hallii]